ncbi:hypothetical protein G7Y89_g13106 [Cudoniella acicularis]|uniref:Methyltransferase domain-containing protein n=1 Tax=Cudoniella acicularis TaxID=354080 RepID=A0A8H4VWD7_9HELO|nr:hypothetical protein G7Y89_g13106 [Cudoniella acicularis]
MPRLPHALLHKAYNTSPLLLLVLRGTRTLDSAINELRWLREHVWETQTPSPRQKLLKLCQRRARGEPLQYILETEAYTSYLARLLNEGLLNSSLKLQAGTIPRTEPTESSLKILDLCSGTGCISLLLYSLLSQRFSGLHIAGWDISPKTVSLAQENLKRNFEHQVLHSAAATAHRQVLFENVDIFADFSEQQKQHLKCDVIISNPPYISKESFNHDTSRSVRNWEPRLALVPEVYHVVSIAAEDVFYDRLIFLHMNVSQSKVLLMEIGDDAQAIRVAKIVMHHQLDKGRSTIEIWRDWPELTPELNEAQEICIDGRNRIYRSPMMNPQLDHILIQETICPSYQTRNIVESLEAEGKSETMKQNVYPKECCKWIALSPPPWVRKYGYFFQAGRRRPMENVFNPQINSGGNGEYQKGTYPPVELFQYPPTLTNLSKAARFRRAETRVSFTLTALAADSQSRLVRSQMRRLHSAQTSIDPNSANPSSAQHVDWLCETSLVAADSYVLDLEKQDALEKDQKEVEQVGTLFAKAFTFLGGKFDDLVLNIPITSQNWGLNMLLGAGSIYVASVTLNPLILGYLNKKH